MNSLHVFWACESAIALVNCAVLGVALCNGTSGSYIHRRLYLLASMEPCSCLACELMTRSRPADLPSSPHGARSVGTYEMAVLNRSRLNP